MSVATLKTWLQNHPNPRFRQMFQTLKQARARGLPTPKLYNLIVLNLFQLISMLWSTSMRLLLHTPAFKGRLTAYGKNLYLYGGIPFVSGPLNITVGDDCRISGQTTFSGRAQTHSPSLEIGNNVDIGWQNTFAVGKRIVLEDNVRLAGGIFLFGYSGHAIDAEARALGAGDDEHDIGDIIIKRDVWLGTNVTVCPNVTIGQGTIVGTGSVVTHDLPEFVVAVGNPARIVRHLKEQPHA
ncbi:acetyltransferase [Vibrio panuliri]|uniref:Acetyltransferase n=1 Tax=Vibrio panuliri TaxID=1381081 RepID=A0A1Q9HIJ8_9VIBR|nr:acyltransferase [Vibrio panuliri]OLQ90147.1 acetyltransferase [Vibrio panuliri]